MKRFVLASLFVSICFGLFAQSKEKIVFKDEVLNGRIKTIQEKRIYTNDTDSFTYVFNESGLLISEESTLFAGLNEKARF